MPRRDNATRLASSDCSKFTAPSVAIAGPVRIRDHPYDLPRHPLGSGDGADALVSLRRAVEILDRSPFYACARCLPTKASDACRWLAKNVPSWQPGVILTIADFGRARSSASTP